MSEPATSQMPAVPRLSPKDKFLALEIYANQWRQMVRSDVLQTALTYALAEYATCHPGSEQLKGAHEFIDLLTSMAEPRPQSRGMFPDKKLNSSVLETPATNQEIKKGK